MSVTPDPEAFAAFALEVVPRMLVEVVGVDEEQADEIGHDIVIRGHAVAALTVQERQTVAMPFFEETCHNDPPEASGLVWALVAVAVRNSALEHAHSDGRLNTGELTAITTAAAGPLSDLLAATDHGDAGEIPGLAVDLAARWRRIGSQSPRAWAAFESLAQVAPRGGGRIGLPASRDLPATVLPKVTTAARRSDQGAIILDAMDPGFDEDTVAMLSKTVSSGTPVVFVATLSRLSRELTKLATAVEFLLASGVSVLTTNYLLRPSDTWTRRQIVAPATTIFEPVDDVRGLTGAHRRLYADVLAQMRRT